MKKILLPNGMSALVDAEDYERVSRYGWHISTGLSSSGRRHVYVHAFWKGVSGNKRIYLHRLVLGVYDKRRVDHINGDGLDNRKCNLRICTQHQNGGNARVWDKPKSSIYKGVYFMRKENKWAAQICLHRKNIRLGAYMTEEEAAIQYDKAAREHFGEFARTNF